MNLAEVELVDTLEAENLNLAYYIHTKPVRAGRSGS